MYPHYKYAIILKYIFIGMIVYYYYHIINGNVHLSNGV